MNSDSVFTGIYELLLLLLKMTIILILVLLPEEEEKQGNVGVYHGLAMLDSFPYALDHGQGLQTEGATGSQLCAANKVGWHSLS